ncbi:hypothetical protein HN018_19555 [Lichenicola cladoniae]|uniref:Uncharacterized protein n=1 Tax=Lichenicola cladoniae TaxID=1484109 RepID=A0A6M8HUS3_9PROT|nr:hypothetical protein [Lichenicola cladoniae]NPD66058.1 hypothetical protein [Acetobacteraceae bacterium]QKE91935.1 hypothetical protein HN018_19555 [Lichenicola cladoniae]
MIELHHHQQTKDSVMTTVDQPEILPVLYDVAGNEYVPRYPTPGLISLPLSAIEIFELYVMFDKRSANAVTQANPEFWAQSEKRADELLALAVTLAPALDVFQRQRRQYPGGENREGTV